MNDRVAHHLSKPGIDESSRAPRLPDAWYRRMPTPRNKTRVALGALTHTYLRIERPLQNSRLTG